MTSARRLHYSYQDYRTLLDRCELKLEFNDGEIYAMATGTPAHAELGARVVTLLSEKTKGTCRVFTSDLMIRVEATGLSTFPDCSVVCGQPQSSPVDANAVTNPTLIVEVTSQSTEDYDRGEKLSNYRQLPTVSAVLIVSHRERRITAHVRNTSGEWTATEYRGGEALTLQSPALTLGVDSVFESIL